MKYLADEDFPHASYKVLLAAGFDIEHVGLLYSGMKDEEIAQIAQRNSQTILTFDSDYGTLALKERIWPSSGIIYFRMPNYTPEEPALRFLSVLKDNLELSWSDRITVITRETVRVRPLSGKGG